MVLEIIVKTLDSQNYQFQADDSWTVLQFKEHIQPTINIPSNEQRLIFCGRVLQNDKKLTDCDCNGKVIHLVRRPPPTEGNQDNQSSSADTNNNSYHQEPMGEMRRLFSGQVFQRRYRGHVSSRLNNALGLLSQARSVMRQCLSRLPPESPLVNTVVVPNEGQSSVEGFWSSQNRVWHRFVPSGNQNEESPPNNTGNTDNEEASSERPTARRLSLSTDDLTRDANDESVRSSGNMRRGSNTMEYLRILHSFFELQDQLRVLTRRYQALLNGYRRGESNQRSSGEGENNTNNNETEPQNQDTNQSNQPERSETRILACCIPRIMHHLSHLQHSLGDFVVDTSRGSANLLIVDDLPSMRRRGSHTTSSNPASEYHGTIGGSITITATTVDTSDLAANSLQQADIMIPVPPGSMPGSIHIPITIPIPIPIHQNFTSGEPHQPNAATEQESVNDRQQSSAQQGSTTNQQSTSEQSRNRSLALPELPMSIAPFDNYLYCSSLWALRDRRHSDRRANLATGPGIQDRTTMPLGTSRTESENARTEEPPRDPRIPQPSLGEGLTSVVSGIIGSIMRPQQQQSTNSNSSQQQVTPNLTLNNNQDPFVNIIPELAVTAASQLLGQFFGVPFGQGQAATQQTTHTQQQQQARPQQPPPRAQTQASTPTTRTQPQTVMMDIDIDDDSSSEAPYVDAHESPSRGASRLPMASQQPSTSRPTNDFHAIKYDREQLVEVLRNHPEWLPIIEADIRVMEQSQPDNPGHTLFSDAYLSSIRKKRK